MRKIARTSMIAAGVVLAGMIAVSIAKHGGLRKVIEELEELDHDMSSSYHDPAK